MVTGAGAGSINLIINLATGGWCLAQRQAPQAVVRGVMGSSESRRSSEPQSESYSRVVDDFSAGLCQAH